MRRHIVINVILIVNGVLYIYIYILLVLPLFWCLLCLNSYKSLSSRGTQLVSTALRSGSHAGHPHGRQGPRGQRVANSPLSTAIATQPKKGSLARAI